MKKLSIITICISIASLLLSFYLIFSENRFDADWGQIITGIMSFLVTILIAWQIWTVIDFERKVKDHTKLVENTLQQKFNSDLQVQKDKTEKYIHENLSASFMNIGHAMMSTHYYVSAITFFSKSTIYLEVLDEDGKENKYKSRMDYIVTCMNLTKAGKSLDNYMISDLKKICIREVSKIDNEFTLKVIDFITQLPEKELG